MSHPDTTARQPPTWSSLAGPDLPDLQAQLDQLKQQVRVLQVAVLALQASSPAPREPVTTSTQAAAILGISRKLLRRRLAELAATRPDLLPPNTSPAGSTRDRWYWPSADALVAWWQDANRRYVRPADGAHRQPNTRVRLAHPPTEEDLSILR